MRTLSVGLVLLLGCGKTRDPGAKPETRLVADCGSEPALEHNGLYAGALTLRCWPRFETVAPAPKRP